MIKSTSVTAEVAGSSPVVPAINQRNSTIDGYSQSIPQFDFFGYLAVAVNGSQRGARLLKRLAQAHGVEAGEKSLSLRGESRLRSGRITGMRLIRLRGV